MSSAFGKKKQAVQLGEQPQLPVWRPRAKDSAAARENVQAFYRITHTEPSRLERARMMREFKLSA